MTWLEIIQANIYKTTSLKKHTMQTHPNFVNVLRLDNINVLEQNLQVQFWLNKTRPQKPRCNVWMSDFYLCLSTIYVVNHQITKSGVVSCAAVFACSLGFIVCSCHQLMFQRHELPSTQILACRSDRELIRFLDNVIELGFIQHALNAIDEWLLLLNLAWLRHRHESIHLFLQQVVAWSEDWEMGTESSPDSEITNLQAARMLQNAAQTWSKVCSWLWTAWRWRWRGSVSVKMDLPMPAQFEVAHILNVDGQQVGCALPWLPDAGMFWWMTATVADWFCGRIENCGGKACCTSSFAPLPTNKSACGWFLQQLVHWFVSHLMSLT